MPRNIFLIHVGDDDFSRLLPKELDRSADDPTRVKVMAFPPLGDPKRWLRSFAGQGTGVQMFDACHPAMKPEPASTAERAPAEPRATPPITSVNGADRLHYDTAPLP
jgi:hypothetical protein